MISLFAGIGAVEMAAKRVYDNVEVVAAAEIDKFARQSYMAIHGINEEHFYKDVRKMEATQYRGAVDLLAFGFPCQDYSIAGKRAGLEGQKGTLFYEGARIINECRPSVFVAENVKGLLSSNGGEDFKTIMNILRNELGYYCHYDVLNTKDYGVPQNRERVFIVGFLDSDAYYRFQFAPKIPLTKRLKDVLEDSVDEKYYLSDRFIQGMEAHKERHKDRGNGFAFEPKSADEIESINCLSCGYGSRNTDTYINEGVVGNREPKILDDQGRKRKQENPVLRSICPTLRAQTHGNEPKVVFTEPKILDDYNGKIKTDGIACALTTSCGSSAERNGQKAITPRCRIRKLTPLECWRLQDFPDEAFYKAEKVVSNSRLYMQAGNSITVAVMEMILRQVRKAVSGDKPKDALF